MEVLNVSENVEMSLIIEQAGGASTTGKGSILEVETNDIDQRVPTYVGNNHLIERLEKILES